MYVIYVCDLRMWSTYVIYVCVNMYAVVHALDLRNIGTLYIIDIY